MGKAKTAAKTTSKEILEIAGIEGVCKLIEDGKSNREIVKLLGVDSLALNKFLYRSENANQFARAKERSAEAWLDRGMEAVDSSLKRSSGIDPAAARAVAQECARRAALRNRQYIEKTAHEHTGPNGGPLQQVNMTPKQYSDIARKHAQEV